MKEKYCGVPDMPCDLRDPFTGICTKRKDTTCLRTVELSTNKSDELAFRYMCMIQRQNQEIISKLDQLLSNQK